MSPYILDGKKIARENEEKFKARINDWTDLPTLIIATCNPDEASKVYLRNKKKACERVGINCEIVEFDASIETHNLLQAISRWNEDYSVCGIIVQLPLPKHINVAAVQRAISPYKDVDGFHPESYFAPCTPEGVMKMLDYYHLDVAGARCVVIGRSDIVGKPLAKMLCDSNATVTLCHSKTPVEHLKFYCQNADFIFCAAGEAGLIKPDFLTPEQSVVIDISINRNEDGKLCGDLHSDAIPLTKAYSPVPGGVGPMTVNTLLDHVITYYTGY